MIKGAVLCRIIWLLSAMLVKVPRNPTILMTNSTRYHKYKEVIPITGGLPLRLPRMSDCTAGKGEVACSLMSTGTKIK